MHADRRERRAGGPTGAAVSARVLRLLSGRGDLTTCMSFMRQVKIKLGAKLHNSTTTNCLEHARVISAHNNQLANCHNLLTFAIVLVLVVKPSN
eukprot:7542885-Pyramimonas_sp.AAC.1